MKKIILIGDPILGYRFIGPFDDFTEVNDFVKATNLGSDHWIGILEEPDSFIDTLKRQKGGKIEER